jgi:hypothetical protein
LILSTGSPQLDPGLFFNAFEGSYRGIPFRMGHRDTAFFWWRA